MSLRGSVDFVVTIRQVLPHLLLPEDSFNNFCERFHVSFTLSFLSIVDGIVALVLFISMVCSN